MKTVLISSILLVCFLICCNQEKPKEFLELNEQQLKDIGFVFSEHGIYFKTNIPKNSDKYDLYCQKGYYNDKDEYGTRGILGMSRDKLDSLDSNRDSSDYYANLPALKVKYYFLKITHRNGKNIYGFSPVDEKVIPILLKQNKYNFDNKGDVIFYLKATDDLKKKLSYIDNLDEYIVRLVEKADDDSKEK